MLVSSSFSGPQLIADVVSIDVPIAALVSSFLFSTLSSPATIVRLARRNLRNLCSSSELKRVQAKLFHQAKAAVKALG